MLPFLCDAHSAKQRVIALRLLINPAQALTYGISPLTVAQQFSNFTRFIAPDSLSQLIQQIIYIRKLRKTNIQV